MTASKSAVAHQHGGRGARRLLTLVVAATMLIGFAGEAWCAPKQPAEIDETDQNLREIRHRVTMSMVEPDVALFTVTRRLSRGWYHGTS